MHLFRAVEIKKDPKWPISSQTIRFLNVLGQLLESAKEMRPAKLKMMLKVLAIESRNSMPAQRDDSRMSPQPSFFMAVINRVEQSQTAQRYRLTLSYNPPPTHTHIGRSMELRLREITTTKENPCEFAAG